MNKKFFLYFNFYLTFKLIESSIVKELIDNSYEKEYYNYDYIQSYKIPLIKMRFKSNGYSISRHELKLAFDDDFNTYWRSLNGQKETFLNNIIVTFSETVVIDKMIYQASLYNNTKGVGYPTELKIYFKLRYPDGTLSEEDSDFLLFDDIFSERSENKVIFLFDDELICDQIKLEWVQIEDFEMQNLYAFANEIIFLSPENEYINKLVLDIFPKNSYNKLIINPQYNDINIIEEIESNLIDYLNKNTYIKDLIYRAKKIINGEIKYEPKREFTTNQAAKLNIINQHGDMSSYTKDILKMSRGGTNRQPTGIYGYSNETITIYVDANDDDPLPSIRFSQYIGMYNKWLSLPYKLIKGKNILTINNFNVEDIEIKIKPGGPIYIENKYTSDEQSQNVKIYFDDGILFPIFILNDNEEEFKKNLDEYVTNYNKSMDNYYNIMELYSNRIMITLNATYAYQIYNIKGESPQKNLLNWDEVIKIFLIFDGIQFEQNQPYYDKRNEYINIHIRYSHNYKKGIAAYAFDEHIGIFYQSYFYNSLVSYEQIGRSLGHEIGHMIDVKQREFAEITNLMFEEFTTEILYRNLYTNRNYESLYDILAPDNIDNSLRNCHKSICEGFFINSGTYSKAFIIWWSIESFHPGYWGQLDNLYRYNSSLNNGMSKNEIMVFYTSLILGFDTGYHFERFGLALANKVLFNNSGASQKYKKNMEEAINQGKINNTLQKKFWYIDSYEYIYMINNGTGCYKNKNDYNIEIIDIIKDNSNGKYNITLPYIDCIGHLGFEIIENGVVIGFTQKLYFIDETEYPDDYNPKYKIAAYDRLLDYKESNYKTYEKNNFKYYNFILTEE